MLNWISKKIILVLIWGIWINGSLLAFQGTLERKNLDDAKQNFVDDPSLCRYATERFFAGAYLDLKTILESPGRRNLPFDLLFSSKLISDRFIDSPVSELVMLLSDSPMDVDGGPSFELAAVVRLKKSMEPIEALKQLARLNLQDGIEPTIRVRKLQIGEQDCYRVPTGTFLNARRRTGSLKFVEEDGTIKPDGYNVGNQTPHQFIRGNTGHSAIFTIDGINRNDFVQGKLRLNLVPEVFRVSRNNGELTKVNVSLKRPGEPLKTEPVSVELSSMSNVQFEISQKLNATDESGKVAVDVLDDLLVNGKVEVVVQCPTSFAYVGFVPSSLGIESGANEYVAMIGDELLVTQNPETLREMLGASGSAKLSKSLHQPNLEVVALGNVQEKSHYDRLSEFLEMIGHSELSLGNGRGGFQIELLAAIDSTVRGKLKLTLEDESQVDSLSKSIQRALKSTRENLADSLLEASTRQSSMDQLRDLVFADIETVSFGSSVPRAEFETYLDSFVTDVMSGFRTKVNENQVEISFEPIRDFGMSNSLEQLSLSAVEIRRFQKLSAQKQFTLASKVLRRTTDRYPNDYSTWMRRAHALSFNMSMNFDGIENRYLWVRKGVESLLEGAAKNQKSVDLLWLVANFIALKVGNSDERVQFQEFFAKDNALHRRLSNYVDIEAARSSSGTIESWLVAKELYELCNRLLAEPGYETYIPSYISLSRPAVVQAGYAASLNERGDFERAVLEWENAESMWAEFGAQTLVVRGTLNLEPIEDEFGLGGTDRQSIEVKLDLIKKLYQRRKWRAKVEQTPNMREIRKNVFDATQLYLRNDYEKAFQSYETLLGSIAQLEAKHPNHAADILTIFSSQIGNSISLSKQLEKPIDRSLAPLLKRFNERPLLPHDLWDNR